MERFESLQSQPRFPHPFSSDLLRRTQKGCGGLGGENPAAFPKAGPIFQQPFCLPENASTLAGIAFRAAGKSGNHFPAASKFAGKLFQQRISDSHSLLEFSDFQARERHINISFLFRLPSGRPRECPRFSLYFTRWKPSLP